MWAISPASAVAHDSCAQIGSSLEREIAMPEAASIQTKWSRTGLHAGHILGRHHERLPLAFVGDRLLRRNRSPGPLHERLHLLLGKPAIFVAIHRLENPFVSRLKLRAMGLVPSPSLSIRLKIMRIMNGGAIAPPPIIPPPIVPPPIIPVVPGPIIPPCPIMPQPIIASLSIVPAPSDRIKQFVLRAGFPTMSKD